MVYKALLAVVLTTGMLASVGFAEDITSVTVSAPIEFPASPDEYVTIPLSLSGTGTLEGFGVQIDYDPAVLELPNVTGSSTTDITLGSSISGWFISTNIEGGQGSVKVSCFDVSAQNSPVDPSDLNILNVYFHVLPTAEAGLTTIGLVDYEDYEWTFQNGSINVVPEPSSLVLLTSLLVSAALATLWRKRQSR